MTATEAVFADAGEHLLAELARLDLELERQVVRRRISGRLAGDPDYRGLYIPDELVDALLAPDPADEATRLAELTAAVAAARERVTRRWAASLAAGVDLPMVRLARNLKLTRFDCDTLLLAVAPEIDQRYAILLAWLQDDVTSRRPSIALALDLWGGPARARLGLRSRFDADAPLSRHGLLVPHTEARTLLDTSLVPDRRVVDHLLGVDDVDVRIRDCVHRVVAGPALAELVLTDRTGIALRDLATRLSIKPGVGVLTGPPASGRQTAALAVAAALDRPVLHLDAACRPTELPVDELLRLSTREAVLTGATLVAEHADRLEARSLVTTATRLRAQGLSLVLTGAAGWQQDTSDWRAAELTAFASRERRQIWARTLASKGLDVQPEMVDAVADTFRLGPGQITAAVAALDDTEAPIGQHELTAAARTRSAHTLGTLACRVDSPYGWPDLVLPHRTRRQLDDIVAAARHRTTVCDTWGFRDVRGLSVLFAGPSGTGKTMSAGLLADELGLDLYAIDLAAIVSKYIGETEKNLDAVFREGAASNAALLFDEADALFGKRSEVKDAHDRYANLEVAFLLQRMEAYDGITILTTNLRANLDDAFARRLAYFVEFPKPDVEHRRLIWQVALPAAVPLADDVDLDFLARQVELTGAGIRNAVLTAAYLAAAEHQPVGMPHLVQAAARELAKTGRLPSRATFRDHYGLLVEVPSR